MGRSLEITSQRREPWRTNIQQKQKYTPVSLPFLFCSSCQNLALGPPATTWSICRDSSVTAWVSSLPPASEDTKSSSEPFQCLEKWEFFDPCFCQIVAFLSYLSSLLGFLPYFFIFLPLWFLKGMDHWMSAGKKISKNCFHSLANEKHINLCLRVCKEVMQSVPFTGMLIQHKGPVLGVE